MVKVIVPMRKKENVENKLKVGKKFKPYPDLDDPDFNQKIYLKKEFYKHRIQKDQRTTKEICNARLYNLAPQQEFLRNYININTPYNGILIYHGTGVGKTCSAIQIAEGFKNMMKRMHSDHRKKILVLLSQRIQPSFQKEIYDIKKESRKQRSDDIVQCTGNTYSLNFEQFSGLTRDQKEKETRRAVNSVYKFFGYEEFGNNLMNQIGWDGKLDTLTETQKKAINKEFKNRILIIDEIHNIKSDVGNVELRKVPPLIQAVIRYGENIRLVLMSATPMYDNAGELIYIINLLLENDGRAPIKKNEIFDSNDKLVPGGEERLKEVAKG
jgi:superfamily II DNA or RNA helicase